MGNVEASMTVKEKRLDEGKLLSALRAFRRGDFSTRLPEDMTGTDGEIAALFNDIIHNNKTMVQEISRVSKAVGFDGKVSDRAALESDRNFMLRIRDREHKLIKKIKKALERIENGTFGICETCGEEISVKRLKARPVTSQCIECKSKEEALEKALGL